MRSTILQLKALRALMLRERISAYVVPSRDAHNSEYLAEHDKRRTFLSGFDGSAGTAVVTHAEALMWTDGRYYLQAEAQMDENWTLMPEGLEETPSREVWLSENVEAGASVGVDPLLMTHNDWCRLYAALSEASVGLKPMTQNLVDKVWGPAQPSYPENPVRPLEMKFAGQHWEDKLSMIRKKMMNKRADCLIISALDEVAWLFNLRGSDVKYNPVFFSYAAVTKTKAYLFISEAQVDSNVREHLKPNTSVDNVVEILPYTDINRFLDELCQDRKLKVWLCASYGIEMLVPETQRILAPSPVSLAKAVKNQTELEGFKKCHVRDAAALCCYLAWLEKKVNSHGESVVTEVSGADELERLRSEMEHYVGLSFSTISSSGPNGAVIHYRPTEETDRRITNEELYLVDSGGQYKDGTTDVTRTLHFGTPTDYEKECFTRVLKGHIRLARTVFPVKCKGHQLDPIARLALWESGLDYLHGTGHGVGAYLNVHEGPTTISYRIVPDDPGIRESMVLSNEPGYYEDGAFGIRLESLVYTVKADTPNNFKGREFLSFDTLTLVPIQQKMIKPSLLSSEEINFLNDYHEKCREEVGELLRELGKQDAINWLMKETEPIG